MANSDDSGDDIFITQSSFRCLDNANTQDVDDAADNMLMDSDPLQDISGEIVEYMDFSEPKQQTYAVFTPELNEAPFVPLLPDLLDDEVYLFYTLSFFLSSYFPMHAFSSFLL